MVEKLIFDYGRQEGFRDMEIYHEKTNNFTCKIFKGEIDDYSIAQEGGISFRGLYKGRMGYAYTEKINGGLAEALVKMAKENASLIESQEEEIIFGGSEKYEDIKLYSDSLARLSIDKKLDFLRELEKEAYALDKRVVSLNYCIYQDFEKQIRICNSRGLNKSQKSNMGLAYISAIVEEDNDIQSGSAFRLVRNFGDLDPKSLAGEAVTKALAYLGARPVASKNYTIILENMAAAKLVQTFSGIFSAENVQKGRSLLRDKLGKVIGSSCLTIVDNPFLASGAASRSFDSEGVASKRLTLVEDGLLKSLLYNLKTAKKDGLRSTGHGYKSSYKGTVAIAPSNLYIRAGDQDYRSMLASMEEGLLITELQGLHAGANPISGDFSLAAKGHYLKDGQIIRPVNQITIAGNFYDLLKNIGAIGNDLAFAMPGASHVGSPSLKIENIAVAGE